MESYYWVCLSTSLQYSYSRDCCMTYTQLTNFKAHILAGRRQPESKTILCNKLFIIVCYTIYISSDSDLIHSCFYFMNYLYYEYCRSNFLITASCDGHIKFWKKTNEEGLVFVKHFRTHLGEFLSPYKNKISSEFQFYLNCILVVIRCLQTL